ncbi:hypothetical protein GA0115257_12317 [Streptomyces sp. LcepLS]|nr:hypothetical protein GA0115257_12317 [Streptomyces sp. LcepLS]
MRLVLGGCLARGPVLAVPRVLVALAGVRGGAVAVARGRGARLLGGAGLRGRGVRQQRGDLALHRVEHRGDLVADVDELDRQPAAELVPRLAVGAREGGEGLEVTEGVVGLVRLAEQPVALARVVLDAVERAADLAEVLVVEAARAAPVHESAGLGEPRPRLVEEQLPAIGVVPGHAEPEVLHPALEPVERVTRQGVAARRRDPAEGPRGDTHREAPCGEPLGEARAGFELAERVRPVGALAGALTGHRRAWAVQARHGALAEHGLHRGDQLGPLDHLHLGVQHGRWQGAESAGECEHPARLVRAVPLLRCGALLCREALCGPLVQGLGEGVRPPVRRDVRDHWRHLLSS